MSKPAPKQDRDFPDWVLWLFDHGFAGLLTLGVGALLLVAAVTFWVDRRLDGLEEQISRRPPKSYTPPDLAALAAPAVPAADIVRQQAVYVPVHSHVYFGGGRPFLLEATLSIHNVSETDELLVRSVRYYNTDGKLIRTLVDELIRLAPLQTIEFVIEQRDSSGGSGANFIVDWQATTELADPLVEVMMVGNAGTQGISFRSVGVPIPPSNVEP